MPVAGGSTPTDYAMDTALQMESNGLVRDTLPVPERLLARNGIGVGIWFGAFAALGLFHGC